MCVVYVDDVISCGHKNEIESLKTHLKKRVNITDIGRLDSHLGVDYKLHTDQDKPYFECSMNKYISDMCAEFENERKMELPNHPTPGKPSTILEKHDGEALEESLHRKYVGKALYAVIKVLPDCANAVRDLTVHLSNPSKECWKDALKNL